MTVVLKGQTVVITARVLDEPRAGRLSMLHHIDPVADQPIEIDGKTYRVTLALYEVKKEKRLPLRNEMQTDAFASTIHD